MRYHLISVRWKNNAVEPVCLCANLDKGLEWSKENLKKRGATYLDLLIDSYNEPIEGFSGIIPL